VKSKRDQIKHPLTLALSKNGAVVKISWNATYEKMCIVYDKGYILVGNIEGTSSKWYLCFGPILLGKRHWSKDLKVKLFDMAWSPDSKKILVAISKARYSVYDSEGQILTTIRLDGVSFSLCIILASCTIPESKRPRQWQHRSHSLDPK